MLIQAIGRICRTSNKNSSINIFVDDDILQSIDFSVAQEDGRLLNPEFKEVVKLSKKEPVGQDNYINLTKAANRNRNVEVRINSLLSENKDIWKERDKVLWETVRDITAEIRLPEAIDRKLLCPFQYFGVTDEVDLSDLKKAIS